MKVLVVGGGGREHALVWKLSKSPLVDQLYCAPGNPGIEQLAECIPISATDIEGLLEFASAHRIDLTIPGPEAPLVAGLVDEFEAKGLPVFGPTRKAAEIEGSKAFAKWFMKKYRIPTADWKVFYDYQEARAWLMERDYPCVVKADGLAAGKGSVVVHTREEALEALKSMMMDRIFGEAGSKVVIEDFMQGEEASIFVICDGKNAAWLAPAQDHKAIFDGDRGPNTGGMGAYAPVPWLDEATMQRIASDIVQPTIHGMALEERPFRGILFIGLMITADGPKVVEYNCRLGDPEAQVVLPLLADDLLEIMTKVAHRQPIPETLARSNGCAVCVVMASGGYPGTYETGKQIIGLDRLAGEDILIFHAGTRRDEKGSLVTAGGRVLSVTAVRETFADAREAAYRAVGKIAFDGAYYRRDIGVRALKSAS